MAGNVHDWTMEANGTFWRAVRGSSYTNGIIGRPASIRSSDITINSLDINGVRVQLYLK